MEFVGRRFSLLPTEWIRVGSELLGDETVVSAVETVWNPLSVRGGGGGGGSLRTRGGRYEDTTLSVSPTSSRAMSSAACICL